MKTLGVYRAAIKIHAGEKLGMLELPPEMNFFCLKSGINQATVTYGKLPKKFSHFLWVLVLQNSEIWEFKYR